MASGTNTTADTVKSRFQYPAQPKPKAKSSGKPKSKSAKAKSGKSNGK